MPTRSKRFLAGIITGYGSIAANIVFTMASIPLALHYLDKENFGLWALALQINGYLGLIDLGMSGAVSRLVADHKDEVDGGEYGSHMLTSALVFVVQGLIIGLSGITFSWFAPDIFAIPHNHEENFRLLLMILASMSGISVATRSLGSPLWAFQRSDVINNCATLGTISSLLLLWLGFASGLGLFAFIIAQLPSFLGTPAVYAWVCHINKYYPSKGHWGKPSLSIFKSTFHFGKDILLITLGSQLINATQIMIISRWISLEAAATFSVATKFYGMAMLLVNNPISAAAPGLTELHVRGEKERFVGRYWDLITLTLAITIISATGLAAGNRSLVKIWTHGSIEWTWTGDLLLGLLIVLRNFNGCFVGMFGLIKNWKPVRHVYLIEGLAFVPVAILFAKWFGLTGVLLASILVHIGVTTTLAARQAVKVLGPWVRVYRNLGTGLALIGIASLFAWYAGLVAINPYAVLGGSTVLMVIAVAVIWFVILPYSMKSEILSRIKAARTGISRKFFRAA
jgi:O-antigen/teichoic acid export membrane protein